MSAELLVGDPAPDFLAVAVGGDYPPEGQQVNLASLRGRRAVLFFYPQNDTPGCTEQACAIRDVWAEFKELAAVFGVNNDTPENHQRVIARLALPFPLLCDEGNRIARAYGLYVGDQGGGDVEGGESDRTRHLHPEPGRPGRNRAAQGGPLQTRLVAPAGAQPLNPAPVNPHLDTAAPVAGPREVWAGRIGAWVLRLLTLTLRVRVEDPAALRERIGGGPFILLFWHNRILMVPVVWNRFFARHRARRGMALTSPSRDGELIAQLIDRFGIGPVRGSATRRGSTALRELARLLKNGHDVAITPDGSRGPLYEIKPGLVLLAQLTGRPVLPISFEFSRAWRLKSWDRLFIPKPFSTVTFRVGELHPVPARPTRRVSSRNASVARPP